MQRTKLEGLFSNPFFDNIKKDNISDEQLKYYAEKFLFKPIKNSQGYFYSKVLCNFKPDISDLDIEVKEDMLKQSLLEVFNNCNVLQYFMDDEDLEKAQNAINRGQFNAKVLKEIMLKLSWMDNVLDSKKVALAILDRFTSKVNAYLEKFVLEKCAKLKKIIDNITSGISLMCYKRLFSNNDCYLNNDLLSYIKEKYNYNDSYNSLGNDGMFLTPLLYDDVDFWKDKTIYTLLNAIERYNSKTHVIKVIDYMFTKLQETERGSLIFSNNYSLEFYNVNLEKNTVNRLKEDFKNNFKLTKVEEEDFLGLLFPIYDLNDSLIKEGKHKFFDFINFIYKDNSTKVKDLLSNLNAILRENEYNNEILNYTLKDSIKHYVFSLRIRDEELLLFLEKMYQDFGTDEAYFKRFYYFIYLVYKYNTENFNEVLYEHLYQLIEMIEIKYGITSSYKISEDLRNTNYLQLKKLLSKYDININDDNKKYYVSALLDRKHALIGEQNIYKELEQIGDAIYEYCVANMIFFDRNSETNPYKLKELVSAKEQLKVAEKIGTDKLYVSRLINTNNNKNMDAVEEFRFGRYQSRHYLADSLEMVIGAICKDLGLEKAIKFTYSILSETFIELHKPEYIEFNLYLMGDLNWDNKDYYNKIFPGLFDNNNEYDSDYRMLGESIKKLLYVIIIGSDDKNKRDYISNYAMMNIFSYNHNGETYYFEFNDFAKIYLNYDYKVGNIEPKKTINCFKDIILNKEENK